MEHLTEEQIETVIASVEGAAEASFSNNVFVAKLSNGAEIKLLALKARIDVAVNGKTIGFVPAENRQRYIDLNRFVRGDTLVAASSNEDNLNDLLATPKAISTLAKVDFMQLFTLPELADIEDLQKGDPNASPVIEVNKNVRTAMRVFDETAMVDLRKPVVQTFVAYLKTIDSPNRAGKKVLTAARAKKILAAEAPTSVI